MDKVRVGILGLGRGRTHLHNLVQVPEAQVIGAADRYPLRPVDRDRKDMETWERVNVDLAALDEDSSSGHGGADIKVARHFCLALLEGRQSPIDVYRCIEYCLPGIIAARSAKLGGVPLPVPDYRPAPFSRTVFWDSLGLPDREPTGEPLAWQDPGTDR